MQTTKAKSSKWLNESGLLEHRFEWQRGFGSFSYSREHRGNVFHYIENQEQHHKKQNFRDEYITLLTEYGVDFNEAYLFDELIWLIE